MKIWKFYRISGVDKEPELYAVTGIKEFAKTFMELRDMNKFKLVKDDVDRDDFANFVKQMRGCYIDTFDIITSSISKNGLIRATSIPMAIPTSEYQLLKDEYDMLFGEFDTIDWRYIYNLDIFNKKILNALIRLGFYSGFRYCCRYITADDEEEIYEKIDMMDFEINLMPDFDEYKLYMFLYGDTYKNFDK